MACTALQTAINANLVNLSAQLVRHGCHLPLYQDVLWSLAAWAMPSARQTLNCGVGTVSAGLQQLQPSHSQQCMSGSKLDSALSTLRLLTTRVAALRSMAHQPSSCSSGSTGINVTSESWLLPHSNSCQKHCQYGYEVHIQNSSSEPMQLLGKTWGVQELSGACRTRSSKGLMGNTPVIGSKETTTYKTGITLNSIKGSMSGSFLFQGVKTGAKHLVPIPPFALTPTAEQYSDPRYMPVEALSYDDLARQPQAQQGEPTMSRSPDESAAVMPPSVASLTTHSFVLG